MADRFDDLLVSFANTGRTPERPRLVSSPMLAALRAAGTRHVFADSADVLEITALVTLGDGVCEEIDGSTANQPLVRKVFDRYLAQLDIAAWAKELRAARPTVSTLELTAAIYAAICGRAGNDVVEPLAAGRPWGVSLQLHIGLENDRAAALRIARCLRRMVPNGIVKVPFAPHRPHCFLLARDLEREGIPVNFTSTFSARQVVAAALLADVTLTNIFMGRINQGLEATLLGEHVDLCAQRELRRARERERVKTLLIVASVREWQTFVHTAGCDVYTAPSAAIREFMEQHEVAPSAVTSQLDTSYAETMTIGEKPRTALGEQRIARLYEVEPELVDFLSKLRRSDEYQRMTEGEQLARAFEQAGFGDFFYDPSPADWQELRKNKLPQLDAPLTRTLAFDTLFTLLADADFAKYQEEMDAQLAPFAA